MANYDTTIRVGTNIDRKGTEVQLMALENQIAKKADKIASIMTKMGEMKDVKLPTQEYKELQKEMSAAEKELEKMTAQDSKLADIEVKIKKLSQTSADLKENMEAAEVRTPTEEYENLERSIEQAKFQLESFTKEQERLQKGGLGKATDKEYLKVAETVKRLQGELQQAVLVGNKEDYAVIENKLNSAKAVLQDLMRNDPRPLGDIKYYDTVERKISGIQNQIAAYENRMKELSNEGKAYSVDANTPEYKALAQKQAAVNRELEKQKELHSEIVQKQAEAVQKTFELKGQMQQLVAEGKDFTLGQDTKEYAKMGQQAQYLRNELSVLTEKHDLLTAKLGNATERYRKFGDAGKKSFKKISKYAEKSSGLLKNIGSRLKSLALSFFIISQISKVFQALTRGIKDGFDNFYKGNEQFRNSIDSLKASLLTLKNSLAAAFAPLVQMVVPYIQKAVEWLTRLIDTVGQFIAAISGQKTYKRAVKQTTEAIKEQTKEQNKQLSNLDKMNVVTSDKDSGKDDVGAADLFEEVPIDNGILDFIQKLKDLLAPIIDYAKKLKDIFMEGFWDGLGDWEYRWQSIKDSLASIKESLIDIFTDPAVLAAADGWAQSVAYMLGSLAGALASIGLTIAANLLGGIAKYLAENKKRIKKYLISMFNIWEEVNLMFADLFQSIAYIFEAFASEQGRQLTANIIGIFVNAFMGITELASKLFRDIAQIIIKPFVDNKEAFRTALEGFLGVLAEVAGTIKQGIDETFDKLNEVYDEHFKPFFDSVAQGLSDLTDHFLEFWNNDVQPILDEWGEKFDILWSEHIQPAINSIIESLGDMANSFKKLWEEAILPLANWIIENVLPILLPIIKMGFDNVMRFVAELSEKISNLVGLLSDTLQLIVNLLTGDFSSAWESAKSIVERATKGIGGYVEELFNKISGLAGAIRSAFGGNYTHSSNGGGTSRASRMSVPSSYTADAAIAALNNVEIPAYATGQVIPRTMKQHLAILGDNNRETEIVSPISTIKQALREEAAALGLVGGNGGQEINLNLTVECEGDRLLYIIQKLDREYFKQHGKHSLA